MESIRLTKQLIEKLNNLKNMFETEEPPENRRDKDYFEKVKEETLPVYSLLEEWEIKALQVVKERKVKLHPQQITSTKENMELLLMHSYYHDARVKRYMELYNSSLYIFELYITNLNENSREGQDE